MMRCSVVTGKPHIFFHMGVWWCVNLDGTLSVSSRLIRFY